MAQPAPQVSPPEALAAGLPQVGEVLAHKYRVERVLGLGGMGVVLAATHLQLQQTVAIKVLLPQVASNPEALARFTREAQAASSIRSEHVAQVLDVGTLDGHGLPYMTLEFLEGVDLGQLLHQRRLLPIVDAVHYVLQACEAVAHAHRLGIVHRDLKPSNLFLTHRVDGQPLIKVLDFGISKVTSPGSDVALTATSFAFGTPMYMSPEQVRSAKYVDPRTDIWALGVILHELLTGRPPFDGETLTALCAAITADPPRPLRRERPDAAEALEAAILHSLQKDVAARPGSVVEFARSIAPFGPPVSQALVESIERIGTSMVPMLSRPSGPSIDANATNSSWETGRLPATSTRRWIALAVGATLGAGALGALGVSLLRPVLVPTVAPTPPSASVPSSSAPPPTSASALNNTPPAPSASVAASSAPSGKVPIPRPPPTGTKKGRSDVQNDRR